jgi:hypothetical protein
MRRIAAVTVFLIVGTLAVSPPVTLALLTAASTPTATFTTGSLLPPAALVGAGGSTASLTWTASTSSAASGYLLLRSATSGSGYTQVGTVTPVSATATADAPGTGTWYYVLDTYLGGWTSANSNEATVMVASQRTSSVVGCDPTMQAPETSGSGHNDGYELNPRNACASGGGNATDARSGTDSSTSCSDPGKDRHRFWGYAFGLPGTVTSVDGITITAIVGQSNSNGSSSICLQLSWDGGVTWSAARQVPLTAASLTTYTSGSPSDTWGHAWTAAQLSASDFRIRVTDVTTVSNKDFRLDFLGASVTYRP